MSDPFVVIMNNKISLNQMNVLVQHLEKKYIGALLTILKINLEQWNITGTVKNPSFRRITEKGTNTTIE